MCAQNGRAATWGRPYGKREDCAEAQGPGSPSPLHTFRARRREIILIRFLGGSADPKNSSQPASVRAQRVRTAGCNLLKKAALPLF